MAIASWKGVELAHNEDYEVVEGNIYFPANSVRAEFFRPSDTETFCPWKGTAGYYHIEVNGEINQDAAWFYPVTKDAAKNIQGYIAFWRGIEVTE